MTARLLTLTQAAARLGVESREVVLLIASGRLRVAGAAEVPTGSRLAWIDAGEVDALAAWRAADLTVEPTPAVARVIRLRQHLRLPGIGPLRTRKTRRKPGRVAA